jgi:hypothetical protein
LAFVFPAKAVFHSHAEIKLHTIHNKSQQYTIMPLRLKPQVSFIYVINWFSMDRVQLGTSVTFSWIATQAAVYSTNQTLFSRKPYAARDFTISSKLCQG